MCMSLISTAASVQCDGSCTLCDNCYLAEFRNGVLAGMEKGQAFPQKMQCIVPGCTALHSTEKVIFLLKTDQYSLVRAFFFTAGQRGLSLAERSMKRAPFSLVLPSEVMSLRGLKDYIHWVYSGNDISAFVSRKAWNEGDINVAMNAGDLFRDERFKEEILVNRRTFDKLGLDFVIKMSSFLADNKRFFDTYVALCLDDFERMVIEFDKRRPWPKEFALAFLNSLELTAEKQIELIPFAAVLAYKYSVMYPEEPMFTNKYERFSVPVNANISPPSFSTLVRPFFCLCGYVLFVY